MTSWWDLGEGSGYHGETLAVHQIVCPFCMVQGNFATAFHAEKKNPRSGKTLNFDTLKCGNCTGYVMVLWSAGLNRFDGTHDYKVLPWPMRMEKHPDYWPEQVGRLWLQARRSLKDENWDAAAIMARTSMQAALRERGANGKNLKEEINDLATRGMLPPLMREWSHEVRELGNDSTHPEPGQKATDPKDARDIVNFLDYLLEYLYDLPERIRQYRARKA
jgi:hypothetical protein